MFTHAPVLAIAAPLLIAFATPLLGKINERLRDFSVALAVLFSFACIIQLGGKILPDGGPLTYVLGASSVGLTLPSGYEVPVRVLLEVDALSFLMGLTASILFVAAGLYSFSHRNWRQVEIDSKFYALFLLLFAGVLGLVFTGDIFNMFVFLEITSIAACGLIGFNLDRGTSQEAAFKTLAIYTVGALLFLFAVGIMYGQHNALNLAYLAGELDYGFLDKVALALFAVSLIMKVGLVPVHLWVPDAYGEAAAPASAVLVANTLAGLYALYRICFSLYGVTLNSTTAGWILTTVGVVSIFVGVSMAFLQNRLKRLIAYCALSQVGYMALGTGVGLTLLGSRQLPNYAFTALQGGIFHLFNDALYMALLFLVADAVIIVTGKRNLDLIGGLAREMKWTAGFALVGVGAIAGLPPFNGFASKLMIYESVFRLNPLLAIVAIIGSIMTLAVLARLFYGAFLGPALPSMEGVREVPLPMKLAMGLLSLSIILLGLFPGLALDHLIEPASRALLEQKHYIDAVVALGGGG